MTGIPANRVACTVELAQKVLKLPDMSASEKTLDVLELARGSLQESN